MFIYHSVSCAASVSVQRLVVRFVPMSEYSRDPDLHLTSTAHPSACLHLTLPQRCRVFSAHLLFAVRVCLFRCVSLSRCDVFCRWRKENRNDMDLSNVPVTLIHRPLAFPCFYEPSPIKKRLGAHWLTHTMCLLWTREDLEGVFVSVF